MAFMQPQVFKATWHRIVTDNGDTFVTSDCVGLVDEDDTSDDANAIRESAKLYIESGTVNAVELCAETFGARFSAPGYMDRTEWSLFASEKDAWAHLISDDASAFTWSIDQTTVHRYCESDACAIALQESVQSIGGILVERDGAFVYCGFASDDANANDDGSDATSADIMQAIHDELETSGFDVEEV